MSPTIVTALGLVLWTLILVGMIAVVRVSASMSTGKAANTFSPSGEDVSPFSGRLCRAHANCYENLPFAIGVLLIAAITERTGVTDGLAYAFLVARIAQSAVHIVSTTVPAVTIRFVFFLVQFVIMIYWTLALLNVL